MCAKVKYGIWNEKKPDMTSVNALVSAGYAPLSAMVLAARGIQNGTQAKTYLDRSAPLPDPFLMTDMALAAGRRLSPQGSIRRGHCLQAGLRPVR